MHPYNEDEILINKGAFYRILKVREGQVDLEFITNEMITNKDDTSRAMEELRKVLRI